MRAKTSPPQPRRGGRDIKKISRSDFSGADGVVLVRKSWTTPPRLRGEEASQLFLTSRSHPSSAEEGKFLVNVTEIPRFARKAVS